MTRPVVPLENPNGAVHRRSIASLLNQVAQTTPNYAKTPEEDSAGVEPVDLSYPPGHVLRYGTIDGGTNTATFTVGSGGDFPDINTALRLLYLGPEYRKDGVKVILQLVSGFVMSEQVFVVGIDLSWIRITSVDAEVTINREALTTSPADINNNWKPAFYYGYGSCGPVIGCLFTMDSTGTASNCNGLMIQGGRGFVLANCGIKNAGERGLHCSQGFVRADGTIWTGAGNIGIRIANGSVAYLAGADASDGDAIGLAVSDAFVSAINLKANNCGTKGATINSGACASLPNLQVKNCGTVGADVFQGAIANLNAADATGSTTGFTVATGGIINATGATGSLSQTANIPTRNGLIFTGDVTEAYGNASVTPDANGEDTIAHGLSDTPSYVTVGIRGDNVNGVDVVSVDGTNITIRVKDASGADVTSGTFTIDWLARV